MNDKAENLRALIASYGACAVAYSGGVDSALVLYFAHEQLGARAVAITGISPSLSLSDLADARRFADEIGTLHYCVKTSEFEQESYLANGADRCFHCKSTLYGVLRPFARRLGIDIVVDGANASDDAGRRPGMAAAGRMKVRSPLREVGLTKDEVRALALECGIPLWNKPASPCLSSRIPTGTRITIEALSKVEIAEQKLHDLGLIDVRVRFHGDIARLELNEEHFGAMFEESMKSAIVKCVKAAGFSFVTIDLEGYRPSGHADPTEKHFITLV